MRVTRRQLQLAKINNETEKVIEFEEFLRCDVEKAEKSKKEADLKKNILEKSGHQTARHPNNEAFITNVSTTKLVANQDRAPFLGDNEENVAYPQFQLTEVHESPDEAPRDRSMIRSPADSGIGENAEIGISSSDLSIYADELERQNDNLTLDVVGRNSVDRANVVVETVDLTEMSTEIRDYKTEPVWSDDEYEVPANKSLSYGEKIEDYQRFKFNKELTELSKINSAAFMGLMKTSFAMTRTEVSKTPQAPESVRPITTRKRAVPHVAKAPTGQKRKRVPGQFPNKLRSLAQDENVPSVSLTEEGVGFIFAPDRFEQDYLQVASKQEKQPINTKKWPSFQRNLNNYGYKQFNVKDVKAKRTGLKMYFRPDEFLAAYPSGSIPHNYKIAKTPQIKKEPTKQMTCTALAIQKTPQSVMPSSQSMLMGEYYPQEPIYSQFMYDYSQASVDHQLAGYSMLPPLSTFRPEEQKPTFDDNDALSIMEIDTIPNFDPILIPL